MKDLPGLERIRLLLFDVDGVLTDGGLLVDEAGRISKRFDIRDGLGLKLAMLAGLDVGLLSGHDSEAVRRRARDLGIELCYTGVSDKEPVFEEILARRELRADQVLYVGDDLLDLPVLLRAGLPVTVPDADPRVLEASVHVTRRRGGHGAVRELVEDFLAATGRLDAVLRRFR